jgi:oligopeptide transport system substrate-binding protein
MSGPVVAIGFVLLLGVGILIASSIFGSGAANPSGPIAGQPTASGTNSGGASGGQINLLGDDPPTLDPHLAGDTSSATYIVEIFSGLVTLGTDLKIKPDLAESYNISQDGLTYTFKLRKDAKFHDGKQVTADDVKYSFERAADPATGSTTAHEYLGDIVGVPDKLAGKAKEISGIRVVDPNTIEIKIDQPKAYFLAKMSYPTAFVVDRNNIEKGGKGWFNKPNGTGPFKLGEWKKGESIVLERNPNFYNGAPKLDRVNFNLAGGSAMTMYENNEIDVTGVGISDIDRVRDKSNPLNAQLSIHDELSIFYVGMNVKMPPFDDPKVRQAFNMAVDKQKIVSSIIKDLLVVANGVLPPGMPGYNDKLKGYSYDPAKAKALVADSKYASGLPDITLTIPGSSSTNPPTVDAMVQMWKENLGANVKIQQIDWPLFLQDVKQNKYQFFQQGWVADYADPQDFLDILFRCNSKENNTGYCNQDVDKLLVQAQVEQSSDKRIQLYQQAEQKIVDDAAWIPTWFGRAYVLVKPRVQGYEVPPMVVPVLGKVSVTGK